MCLCGERGTGKQLLVEQKRVSDPLLLELQAVESCSVRGLGTDLESSAREVQALNHRAFSSDPSVSS